MPCMFCADGSTLTREHVFPRWLRRCFPDVEEVDYVRRFRAPGSDEEVHERPGVLCDLTVRDVCEGCNTGWMHDLEEAARPVLARLAQDEPTTLDAVEQHRLATWATKTLLTLQATNLGGERVVSLDAASWFYRHQSPLPGGHVWLCRYEGDGQWPFSVHQHGIVLFRADDPPPSQETATNAYGVVYSVGHAAFWLFGHEMADGPVTNGSSDSTHLLIWPTSGASVRWPPPESLATDVELETLSRRMPGAA